MITDATKQQIEAEAGEAVQLRKVSFQDLARGVAYVLRPVAPLPQFLPADATEAATVQARAARLRSVAERFTYRGARIIYS